MFNEYNGINFIILTYTDITMLRRLQTADIHENGKTNIRHLCQRSIVFSTVLKKNPFTYGQLTPGKNSIVSENNTYARPLLLQKENILSFIILNYPTTLMYSKPDEQIF